MSRLSPPRNAGSSIATVERPGAGPSLSAPVEPVTKGQVARLVGGGVLIYGGLVVVGLIITRALAGSTLISDEASISRWFAAHRTGTWNQLTHIGTMLSDTVTAIVLTALLVVLLRVWLGRWREPVVVLSAILGELFIFLLVTNSIGRPRPPVVRLDAAPPTSSFPSGHTAAAVALYGCLAVILLRRMTQRALARAIAVICCCVPVIVGISRVYRGMHYVSDVVFGAVGGGLWLLLVVTLLYSRRASAVTR